MDEQISISSIKNLLVQFLIFVFLTVTLPLTILLAFSSILYRTSVKYAANLFRKDLSSMVTAIGNLYAGDKFQNTPLANIVVVLVLEGLIDCEKIKQSFMNIVFDSEGKSTYPELRQCLVKWGGYHFWAANKNFNIDNHFKVINENITVREDDLNPLCQESLRKNWDITSSPWEITVVNNYIPDPSLTSEPHSLVIWSSHHCLADGYSLLYLLTESVNRQKVVIAAPSIPIRNFVETLAYVILFPFKLLWELSELLMDVPKSFSFNPPIELSQERQIVTGISPLIPISKIKDVKNHYCTSFNAVQFAALAGAVREYHLNRDIPVPDFYPCMIPLPHLRRKLYKLRNYLGVAQTYLPTYEKDMYKRLLCTTRDFLRIKKSTFPVASFYLFSLTGCLPRVFIKKIIMKHHVFPMGISSFPAGLEQCYFLGHKVKDCLSLTGTLEGNAGFTTVLISYLDGVRISGVARSTVMSEENVSQILSLFVKHIDELHKMAMQDENQKNFETV